MCENGSNDPPIIDEEYLFMWEMFGHISSIIGPMEPVPPKISEALDDIDLFDIL